MPDNLEIINLRKRIGDRDILRNVNWQLSTGDLVALTGPNGAGKTTLLRLLAGLSRASSGQILWNGVALTLAHGQVGYLGHAPMLYDNLSVLENLEFFGRMYGKTIKQVRPLLHDVGMDAFRFELVSTLSRGMKQRLALARTVLLDPALVLYDEPFTGLDVEGQGLLRTILGRWREKAIQIVVTHEKQQLAGLEFWEARLQDGSLAEVKEEVSGGV